MHRPFASCVAVVLLSLAIARPARADSWPLPQQKAVESGDHSVRLIVTPRQLSSQLDSFSSKEKGLEPAGQGTGEHAETARARLERRDGGGWTTVWERPLLNEVAPIDAIISVDGRYTVTFDNWHMLGFGKHVVVIYGPNGTLVRSLKLADILPDDYIEGLPTTVSSLWWWGGVHAISPDGTQLLLRVAIPSEKEALSESAENITVAVDLESGRVLPPSGPAWAAALTRAQAIAAEKRAEAAAWRAAFIAPLSGPQDGGEREWYSYLFEAFYRIDPNWEKESPSTTVLRLPGAADYKPSEDEVRERLLRQGFPNSVIMIASMAPPDHLLSVIAAAVQNARAGSLKGVRIYVAAPAAYGPRLAGILEPTEATFHLLDPAVPISQRPERLARFEGK